MIDLHCHSLYSDGTDAPEALPALAEAAGLRALALTDHDTVDGVSRFLAQQPFVTVRLLVGTELSCHFMGKSLHVLGLLVDPGNQVFAGRLKELRGRREERNTRLLARLLELGVPLTLAAVQAEADSPLLSRVHVAKALVTQGRFRTIQEAFSRLLGDGKPGCVPREELTPADAARWIREAGGVPLVAHPGRFAGPSFRWYEAMTELRASGMAGFETIYGDYGPSEESYFRALAQRLGMVQSGGSDYHGDNKPGVTLGRGRKGIRVPDEFLDGIERSQALGDWN
jgi:hypothetical protein